MAGFTYATLTTAIRDYTEVDSSLFTSSIIDNFIMSAENRINREFDSIISDFKLIFISKK